MKIITKSEQETYDFAYNFAKSVKDNAVICLNGDLGAGKTVFVKGFAKYFNVNEISSPTFTIVNEYNGDKTIYHFDVYRLTDENDFYDIGGEEYIGNGICIIEWSNIIKEALPKDAIQISINKISENEREIEVS
ncbi:MAG: tRNA (adenosine(37)-N6)-threonylcarbamoyltransferase complex ATPase subunit type 1 TsaE [Clostridia bacterium]|nr:tRNA (adenosine(37)-N6)-threonylcarbamoyltransferase complex ATPase subunit type 1 TsaE [Clostridia bacterium]